MTLLYYDGYCWELFWPDAMLRTAFVGILAGMTVDWKWPWFGGPALAPTTPYALDGCLNVWSAGWTGFVGLAPPLKSSLPPSTTFTCCVGFLALVCCWFVEYCKIYLRFITLPKLPLPPSWAYCEACFSDDLWTCSGCCYEACESALLDVR